MKAAVVILHNNLAIWFSYGMRSVQRSIIAVGVTAIAGFGSVSGAAAKPNSALKVSPAKPGVKTPITLSFRVPKLAPKLRESKMYYGALLRVDSNSAYAPDPCITDFPVVAFRAVRGGTFTATLNPRTAIDPKLRRWCNGVGRVEVRRYGPWPWTTRVLATRHFVVGTGMAHLGPAPPVQDLGVPVKMTVLAGSTITASAPGRPDRSSPVAGTFRGWIPGMFHPNTDVGVDYTTGGLVPTAFPADPLCPGTTAPASFDLAATSHQTLAASGQGNTTLILNGGPSQLFGCGPAGPLTGTTTIPLSGHVGPKGLLELSLTGSVSDIPLPGGSTGGLAANLTVNIDLSGKD